jgi:acetylornithine aminotransferase
MEIERADLVRAAAERGDQLRAVVAAIGSPLVDGVRGRGLLLGVALTRPVAAEVAAAALERGLVVNAANDSTIRLAPPLIIGDAEVDEFAELFAAALRVVAEPAATTPTAGRSA